jgi:glycosyltransferase involved in cell wall biosynthesis
LPAVRRVAHACRGLLFNSEGEFELAVRLFGPGIIKKSTIVRQGVEVVTDPSTFPERVGNFVPHRERYVLNLGRQDPRKNVSLLVQAFSEYRRRNPLSRLKLVLAGSRSMSYGDSSKAIVDLGVVTEPEKAALLAHARALAQPSIMESYSRVMMESWMFARPVVVHEDCDATASVVRQCGGGLAAGSMDGWTRALGELDDAEDSALNAMGNRGHEHALQCASWPPVVEAYERAIGLFVVERRSRNRVSEIIQIYPEHIYPAQRYAESLARSLKLLSVRSRVAHPDEPRRESVPAVVHHLPGEEHAIDWVRPGERDALVHHDVPRRCDRAPSDAAEAFPRELCGYKHVFASTPDGLDALGAWDFKGVQLLPICVDPRDWDGDDDRPLAKALQDGSTNLVHAGPIVSMRALDELITVFLHYLTLERETRLVLARQGELDAAVYAALSAKIRSLELADRILLANDLTGPQLQSIYRTADLFVSLDPDDSLGESFLQAMWFDIPILAYKTPTSSLLLGDSGVLINDKSNLPVVAGLAQMIVSDADLRSRIVRAQRRARKKFDGEVIARRLLASVAASPSSNGKLFPASIGEAEAARSEARGPGR